MEKEDLLRDILEVQKEIRETLQENHKDLVRVILETREEIREILEKNRKAEIEKHGEMMRQLFKIEDKILSSRRE
ncbi:MAG TPA: hypothetical protein DHV62_01870 [Elusimicrobia bacterium]|jgi:replicative DNA helicase|nr:hypothetical protein [Elusimicrobiota bacterium]